MSHEDKKTVAPTVEHVDSTVEGAGRPARCAMMHGDGLVGVADTAGCILPEGHDGPHEFVAQDGSHWRWETDLSCDCEHCVRYEGDYCTTYWQA